MQKRIKMLVWLVDIFPHDLRPIETKLAFFRLFYTVTMTTTE